jgi:predicted amidophosphoribosyltransferase
MHWTRRTLRGVQTTEVLAEAMACELKIPTDRRVLRSVRSTRKQSLLSPMERQRNVRHAFASRAGCHLAGRYVGLVDDALTTGATANEAAGVLKAAGAPRVSVFVVARAARR